LELRGIDIVETRPLPYRLVDVLRRGKREKRGCRQGCLFNVFFLNVVIFSSLSSQLYFRTYITPHTHLNTMMQAKLEHNCEMEDRNETSNVISPMTQHGLGRTSSQQAGNVDIPRNNLQDAPKLPLSYPEHREGSGNRWLTVQFGSSVCKLPVFEYATDAHLSLANPGIKAPDSKNGGGHTSLNQQRISKAYQLNSKPDGKVYQDWSERLSGSTSLHLNEPTETYGAIGSQRFSQHQASEEPATSA